MRHRFRLFTTLLLLSVAAAPAHAKAPARFGGVPVVVLSGTHYERGVAHGKALHKEIVDLVDSYLLRDINPVLFFAMLSTAAGRMEAPAGLVEEARGLVAGARKANGGTFRSRHRTVDFTWQEILALNTYVDYIGTKCSSVSAWGEKAGADLAGETAIARNLDWSRHPGLLRNQAIFLHLPAEKGEQPFISVGFAGFLGCLSCINKAGLGAFLNLGYGDRAGTFPPDEPFTPAALAFRAAVEAAPADGEKLLPGFIRRLTATARVGSFIIQAVAPRRNGQEDPAAVVELLPDRHAVRRAGDEKPTPGPVLIATNHNRKLGRPRSCSRYEQALEAAADKAPLAPDRLWQVLDSMARSDTMQRMLYIPATGEFRLTTLQPPTPALTPVTTTDLDDWWP